MRAAAIILLVCTLESSAAFTLPVHTYSWQLFQNCYDRAAISHEISRSTTLLRSESTKQTLETDEVSLFNTHAQCTRINFSINPKVFNCIKLKSAEYEYNEADFADYTTDLSDVDEDGSDLLLDMELDLDNLDLDELDLYPDYNDIGGFDLSPFEKHAREVFLTYAEQVQSTIDHDADDLSAEGQKNVDTVLENAAISKKDLYSMLLALDIEATEDESKALFKYLDIVSCCLRCYMLSLC